MYTKIFKSGSKEHYVPVLKIQFHVRPFYNVGSGPELSKNQLWKRATMIERFNKTHEENILSYGKQYYAVRIYQIDFYCFEATFNIPFNL